MHPLDGSFLKLHRAQEHFKVADDLVKGLKNRKVYDLELEIIGEGQTKEGLLRFKQSEDLPTSLPLVIGDIFNNLRSALDYLVWQLWLLKAPTFTKNVKFPIWDTKDKFRDNAPKDIGNDAVKGLSDAQRAAIESLQPYGRGNNALSVLRDANDSDKHRLIQVIGLIGKLRTIRITLDQFRALVRVPVQPITVRIPSGVKIEDGAIVARIPLNSVSRGTDVRVQSRFTVEYAFFGGKLDKPYLIEPVLYKMFSEVNYAITTLEPEFAQFGISTFR